MSEANFSRLPARPRKRITCRAHASPRSSRIRFIECYVQLIGEYEPRRIQGEILGNADFHLGSPALIVNTSESGKVAEVRAQRGRGDLRAHFRPAHARVVGREIEKGRT